MGKIPNFRFCNGQNLGDIFICPEFPVVRDAPLDIKIYYIEKKILHQIREKFVMSHPWKKILSWPIPGQKKKFVMPQKGPEIMHLARKIQNFDQARRQTPEKQDNWKMYFCNKQKSIFHPLHN